MSVGEQARRTYLESQIQTATPQRLHLMLLDGAIRFAKRAQDAWGETEMSVESTQALTRCRNILAELTGSVRDGFEVSQRLRDLYLFLYRHVVEAQLDGDAETLSEVIEVLEVERETWRQFCERYPEAPTPAALAEMRPKEVTARGVEAIPAAQSTVSSPDGGGARFSLEA